jgi:LuxR family maltose regulon positive regulatory protein
VRAKLVPPTLPDGLIVRERILAQLARQRRFTLVSAMPGYGKTALVRQWIDTLDGSVAWLSLDVLDQEPTTFWSHLLVALGAAVPGVEDEPAQLLWERGPGNPLFLSALIAGLAEVPDPVVLVLDGLSGQLDRATLEGVALLVDRAGETLRLVATTRTDPPLPLARWRSVGWLADVREDDLRLTDEEAIAIAAAADTSFRAAADIVALNQRVIGWPIALHMALLARPGDVVPDRPPTDLLAGTDRLLANYLAAEVLEAMSEGERDVALALSVLEWFDPDLCRDLIGAHGAGAIRQLLRRGMFLTVVDPRTGSMRFHDLFRELMEIELGDRDPELRLRLHRRAAMLWRERGDLMSAYHHLSVIGETAKARDLLIGPAFELVDRGDLDALRRFATLLPTPPRVGNAHMALDLAVITSYADGTLAARRWCDRAATLMDGSPTQDPLEADELALRLQGIRCAISLLEADLDTAVAGIATHRGLAAVGPRSNDAFEQRFSILAARVMLGARLREEADEWITLAERLDGPEILDAVTVPTLRAWHEWLFGDLERCSALIDDALGWMTQHGIGAHHLAFDTLITGGWARLSTGHIADATHLAARAAADADTLGHAWNQLQAGYLAARLALVTGDPARALATVDELRALIAFAGSQAYADRLLSVEVEALAASGRPLDATRLIPSLAHGPRRQLLTARFQGLADRDVETVLEGRASWPVLERLQAELVLTTRQQGATPPDELSAIVAECGKSGWVLPFLGFGPRVERMLLALPLADVHPQLASALAFIAPSAPLRRDPHGVRLTSRELTLVELLPTHLSYAEIGERLYLSVNTVKSNLKALYRKLDATTRTEAVEASRRAGLI